MTVRADTLRRLRGWVSSHGLLVWSELPAAWLGALVMIDAPESATYAACLRPAASPF